MYSPEIKEVFLQLVRLGIGQTSVTSSKYQVLGHIDWQALKSLADEQGLSAIILDGIEKLPDSCRPPQIELLNWIGEVLQEYEYRYESYKKAIGNLTGFYNQHGFKMMVLKGYACAMNWPKPEHRPCGDIDIWQFGQQKESDNILAKEKGIKIDNSHHHHTVFEWQEFTVENHYDFINVHHHKSHLVLEKKLKELGADDSHFVEVYGEKVYLPSANSHALFLLKHAALHFVGTELTFRQILDWAFFVEKHGKDVDWKMLLPIIEEHGMTPFLNILNAICVGELCFDAKLFPTVQFNPDVKERVVNEVFASVYDGDKDSNIFSRNLNRYRRWKGNAWKHELCYKESMWSAFWSGVWGHLMKPSTL